MARKSEKLEHEARQARTLENTLAGSNSSQFPLFQKIPDDCWYAAAAAAKSLQLCPTLCDPHRRQPTRLPCPWDSPGKNTGVGCHFLLQSVKVKSECEVAQSCPTLSMDCSPPGSSVHGIFQARVSEWVASAFSGLLVYSGSNPEYSLEGLMLKLKPPKS